MDWSNALGNIIQKYTGGGAGTAAAPESVHDDFQQVAQSAPQDVKSDAIEQTFRSDQTPPFPQMVSSLFSHADDSRRAGLLNRLLGGMGPGALTAIPGLAGLSSLLGGGQQVTPEQASRVSPDEVASLAAHAEKQNPGVVNQVSGFVAQHPDVMKALGGLALAVFMQHIARRR
jgi:hypothetical protein